MANGVLVLITEVADGGLSAAGREAVALGGSIAGSFGVDLRVAVLAPNGAAAATEALQLGAASAGAVEGGALLTTESLVATASATATAADPRVIVVNRGAHVLDLVPRLAARLKGGCVMNVTEARVVEGDLQAVAAIYGGAARAVYRFTASGPRVISGAPGAAAVPARDPSRGGSVDRIAPVAPSGRVTVVEAARPSEGPRLEDARIVVSGGRGLKEKDNYGLVRELAAEFRGLPGASRAIVDDGWAVPAEQVGLTGRIVTPDLYIAAGISGASQHMAGCSNSRTLVAVNTDAQAPIFRYAHLGVVDDCLEVLPELTKLVRKRNSGG